MAEINFKNKRTGDVCNIFSGHFFHCMERKAKDNVRKSIEFPLKTKSGEFDNVDEMFNFLDKFRFGNFKVKDHKAQSYDGVIHNTLMHGNQKNAIFSYIYNELQRDIGIIIKKSDFDLVCKSIINHLREMGEKVNLPKWESFQSKMVEGDIIYAYIESYIFHVEIEDIEISKILENKNLFDKFNKILSDYSNSRIGDLSEILSQEFDDVSELLTPEEECEIVEEKMERLEDKNLDDYFFENNYNALTVLDSIR